MSLRIVTQSGEEHIISGVNQPLEDTKNSVVNFTSEDSLNPSEWTDIELVSSGNTHQTLFKKLSLAVKNLRYLFKMIGTTDISTVADGTLTGAIKDLSDEVHHMGDMVKLYGDAILAQGATIELPESISSFRGLLFCHSLNTETTTHLLPTYVPVPVFKIFMSLCSNGMVLQGYDTRYGRISYVDDYHIYINTVSSGNVSRIYGIR